MAATELSDHFNGKIFLNPVPTTVTKPGAMIKMLKKMFTGTDGRVPRSRLGPFSVDVKQLHSPSKENIRVIWLGHSTLLIEIEGKKILTDPVYSRYSSPVPFLGPERFFDIPLPIDEIPDLSGIIISHDHYDHLDVVAVKKLARRGFRFFCPLKVGDRLKTYGVPEGNIQEFDWWDELEIDKDLKLVATPARHFSGRSLLDRFQTLWASWVLAGKEATVFYGADSGFFPGFREIGEKYGPFDLTMLEVGAYNLNYWPEIHMGPEKAVEAHLALNGKVMLPIHWGTFNLALHPWKEPAELVIAQAAKQQVSLLLPRPGEIVNPAKPEISYWWAEYD